MTRLASVPLPRPQRPRRRAFTLIEMLLVIVIIAILSGFVFSMVRMVGRHADRAKTRRTIEMLANAIEEFRAEYGKYPPVPVYEDPDTELPGQPLYYEYVHRDGVDEDRINGIAANDGPLFTFGLLSFLVPRYSDDHATNSPSSALKTSQWKTYNEGEDDRPRDLRATQRFKPYVDPILSGHWPERSVAGYTYNNYRVTVRDAWDRDLKYRSNPPYETYRLWSVGPDGEDRPCSACQARIRAGNPPDPSCKTCADYERDNIVVGTE